MKIKYRPRNVCFTSAWMLDFLVVSGTSLTLLDLSLDANMMLNSWVSSGKFCNSILQCAVSSFTLFKHVPKSKQKEAFTFPKTSLEQPLSEWA